MALEIIDKKIVGTIDNLEDKLAGKLPVDRLELLVLVDSWGRSETFFTYNNDIKIKIKKCEATQSEQALLVRKECYDLSKLDVSEITNMEDLFLGSNFTDIHSTNGIGLHNNIHSSNGVGLHTDIYSTNRIGFHNVDIHSMNGIGLDNGDISNWNVSNVTNMSFMFHRSYNFNCDIENWDTSKVTDMNSMFSYAYNFNQNIGNWDTSRVTNMKRLFNGATLFNQDISKWDVSKITNMYGMFYEAKNFNQDISKWNTSEVTDMNCMFYCAKNFNQNISSWDISKVTTMKEIFAYTIKFNQNISKWNLENIKNIDYMFYKAEAFYKKFNNNIPLPLENNDLKEWFNLNRDKMNEIDIKDQYGEEIDMFFNKFTDIHSINKI